MTLIRLGGCPGWSEFSLDAQAILLVLSCGGSYFFYFSGSKGVSVDRAYLGAFVTSLEMAGLSITVLHLNDTFRRCLGKFNITSLSIYCMNYCGLCVTKIVTCPISRPSYQIWCDCKIFSASGQNYSPSDFCGTWTKKLINCRPTWKSDELPKAPEINVLICFASFI